MCYAVIGEDVAAFVKAQVLERHERLAERRDLNIAIDPEMLAVIQASTAISTTKGSSAHLLKVGSKRRRTRAEMEEFRAIRDNPLEALAAKDDALAAKDDALAEREARIAALEEEVLASKSRLAAGA